MAHTDFEDLAALDAVGALTEQEATQLADHLEVCPACEKVSAEFSEAATALAFSIEAIEPPPSVRRRVFEITRSESARFAPKTSRNSAAWWLSAAAVFFLALFGWSELRLRAAREKIQEAESQRASLDEENSRLRQRSVGLESKVASLTSAATRTIQLTGQEASPSASARVFLDESRRRAFVFFHDLPANPGDKSYQLWIIRSDKPTPEGAGVFDVGGDGAAQIVVENLPTGTEIQALAVTLEPKGGVSAPTGRKFLVGS